MADALAQQNLITMHLSRLTNLVTLYKVLFLNTKRLGGRKSVEPV